MSLLPPEDPAVRFQIWLRKSRRPYQKPPEQQKPQLHKGLLREKTKLSFKETTAASVFTVCSNSTQHEALTVFFFSTVRNWIEIEKHTAFPLMPH